MDFLFDTSGFMPRGQCGDWGSVAYLYIAGQAGIAAAYFAIPVILLGSLLHNARFRARKRLICLFVAFIFLCGGGHLLEGVGAFWFPAYRLFAVWHAATAVVSIATACYLAPLLTRYLQE